ncbi:MAG: zinc ribbon domain-containing protein [Solirubrobacterales bacterium]
MSILKKIGDTIASTAQTVGEKSVELVSQGKHKVEQMQLEAKANEKLRELGSLIYHAALLGQPAEDDAVKTLCDEVKALKDQAESLEKLIKETPEAKAEAAPEAAPVAARFCTKCGAQILDENKFCGGCGSKVDA